MYTELALSHGSVLWQSESAASETIPADGCVDVILLDDELWIAGPSTQRIETHPDGETVTIGIRFAPGRASEVLKVALADIRDTQALAQELVGTRHARKIEQAMRAFVISIEPHQTTRLALPWSLQSGDWVQIVRGEARRQTALPDVAHKLGWSERHLHRHMTASFGYGYPTLVRIERARHAQSLISGGEKLGVTASMSGYADQSHMNRELLRFVGMTPGQLAASSAYKSTELPSGSSRVA
jgi:AraC-like DNA-binding protein